MNKKIILIIVVVLVVGIVGGYALALSQKNNQSIKVEDQEVTAQKQNINKANCLADECLAVNDLEYPAGSLSSEAKEALVEAINDEYKAHALYEKTIAKLGLVRPFSMIIRAEEQHIASLKSLFDKYGLEIPADNWAGKVSAESTLQQACGAGVEAEIANAKLYREKLLPMAEGYEDIQAVFTNLMNASEQKHLKAFERCN